MPISPENKKLYPSNWKQIQYEIVHLKAKNLCENCGVKNHSIIKRSLGGNFRYATEKEEELFQKWWDESPKLRKEGLARFKFTYVVLTVAHLDHNPQNNEPENLKALCQRCHLIYDQQHHWKTRKEKRYGLQ